MPIRFGTTLSNPYLKKIIIKVDLECIYISSNSYLINVDCCTIVTIVFCFMTYHGPSILYTIYKQSRQGRY